LGLDPEGVLVGSEDLEVQQPDISLDLQLADAVQVLDPVPVVQLVEAVDGDPEPLGLTQDDHLQGIKPATTVHSNQQLYV